ncbi:MAG TPA: hypothetical protein VH482_06425, partial [Thermomicrobiales bacterium]
MQRTIVVMRLFATLGLSLWLVGAASFHAAAQGNETGNGTGTEQTDDGNATGNSTGDSGEEPTESPPATGTLTVHAYVCTTGGDPGTGAIFAEGDFSPDGSCTDSTATITIDGGDPVEVDGSADFPLDAGTHSLADTTGATLDVDLAADATTTVSVVAYAAPKEEPTPTGEPQSAEAPASTTIHLIKHDCAPSIQTADDFAALTADDKWTVCPVITLDGNDGPNGAIGGGHASFDFSFAVDGGDSQTLVGNATFTPAQMCESDAAIGKDVDGDGEQNTCFDASDYAVTIQGGPVTVSETTVPDSHRFGAVELPDANDAAALDPNSVDVAVGQFVVDPTLDTSGDGSLVVHVYNFSPPRVTIVVHDCPDSVKNAGDFADLGDFPAKLKGCPVVTRNDDDGPIDGADGAHADVRVTVTDSDATEHVISHANFVPAQVCESDLGVDLDGDNSTDLCLDVSGYAYDDVALGDVTVTETKFPDGYGLGAAETDPVGDAPPSNVDAENGVVTLDTSTDGEVTLHLFNFATQKGGGDGGNSGGDTG